MNAKLMALSARLNQSAMARGVVGAVALAGGSAANAAIDVSSATTSLVTDGTAAITTVGLALITLAGVAVVFKWVKASFF